MCSCVNREVREDQRGRRQLGWGDEGSRCLRETVAAVAGTPEGPGPGAAREPKVWISGCIKEADGVTHYLVL